MTEQNLISNLNTVKEYFSHNIRTSTAMVVASVSVFKFGLDTDNDDISEIIIESSYFLDIYDKAMEIMFNYVLDNPIRNDKENVAPLKVIEMVIDNLRKTIKEQGVEVNCKFKDNIIFPNTNSYVIKSIIEVILCEEIKKSDLGITIYAENNTITIEKHMKSDYPEIYNLFANLLKQLNIKLTFNTENTTLRLLS